MKKYIILFLSTILCITGIFTFGRITADALEVSVYIVKLSDADNTVTASGKLEYNTENTVMSDNYFIINKIYVSGGDTVKKGDPLITVLEPVSSDMIPYSYSEMDTLISMFSKSDISEDILREIKKYCTERTIYAKSDGVVSTVAHNENEIVNKNTLLMKLSDSSTLVIPVNINEAYIEKIKIGQKASIKFTALENKKFSGEVCSISKEAKQTSGLTGKETSVEVKIKLDDTDEKLRIGYSAECTITTSTDKNKIILPYEYMRSDEKGDYVFIARGNQAVKKYIKTGAEYKNGIEVKSGLRVKDRIIKDLGDVSDGQRIIISAGESSV